MTHIIAQTHSSWELTSLPNLEKTIRLLYEDRSSYYSN